VEVLDFTTYFLALFLFHLKRRMCNCV
jgi:hypothetical protein